MTDEKLTEKARKCIAKMSREDKLDHIGFVELYLDYNATVKPLDYKIYTLLIEEFEKE